MVNLSIKYLYSTILIGSEIHEWHTYGAIRDSSGWWSLAIDGIVVAPDFWNDGLINSFNWAEINLHDPSEVEWVRISIPEPIPAPSAVVLSSIRAGFVSWLRRRRAL